MRLVNFLRSLSPSVALDALRKRGVVQNCTKVSDELALPHGASVYVGFDPTADSLHVGNLMTIMVLLRLQRMGYQPIALVGGATGRIGDPSGHKTDRKRLSMDALSKNIDGVSEVIRRIFANANLLSTGVSLLPVRVVNNAEWYDNMMVIDFMSNISWHFRVSAMLNKESVNQRMQTGEGINFTEFSYPVFQAYDFLYLHQKHDCWLQVGGGDQWGNITAGCEFVRKSSGSVVHGLSVPLVTTSTGEKIGKSAGNAVWLSEAKTSPYHLYQYFINMADQDVHPFLKHFTFTSLEEIDEIVMEHWKHPEKRLAQKHLAEHVTNLVHGEEGVRMAVNATAALFGDPGALCRLPANSLEQLFANVPVTELDRSICNDQTKIINIVHATGALPEYQAKQILSGGGIYLNQIRIQSASEMFNPEVHLLHGRFSILRIGKKNYQLIKWNDVK